MKISVVTPSVREEMLGVTKRAVGRQDFDDFEWIVCSPFEYPDCVWVKDPGKKEGDYYSLNKAYNAAFRKAKGELVVSLQDGIDIKGDYLSRFWYHHQNMNGKACIGAVGDQYLSLDPPIKVWVDPRKRSDFGSFYEINPIDLEFTFCAIPRAAIWDCGGLDEEYDKGAAVGEKELCLRIDKLGYKFYIDQTIDYRAIKHPRLTPDWDARYQVACDLFAIHSHEFVEGTRTQKLPFLEGEMG